ncbi:MAG: formate dehydrogenase accessory protein FdhE [Actinophytocola sp.]|nr:formate dehydrogenase accessory protein FdhE [Actinophytocola sp.]
MPRGDVMRTSPWAASARRAETLRDRHDFAAEVLTLYLALLEVWHETWAAAQTGLEEDQPPEAVASWTAEHVLPRVVSVTAESGPQPLVESLFPNPAKDVNSAGDLLAAYLAGEDLVPVERYLARASLRGPLEWVNAGAACAKDPAPRNDRRCPRCGGPPQLSFRTDTGERLVSGRRQLLCARCGHGWNFSSSTCAACGETAGARRTVYAEHHEGTKVGRPDNGDGAGAKDTTFGHLRVEGCASCRRYLIDVDLGRDPRAVPEVDELAALPLDLYAAEQGLSKITPNLMGF